MDGMMGCKEKWMWLRGVAVIPSYSLTLLGSSQLPDNSILQLSEFERWANNAFITLL